MEARSAMTREVVVTTADDNIADAYEIMSEWDIRHLPVVDGARLIGILSDRDILRYAQTDALRRSVIPRLPVAQAMTRNPITCGEFANLADVGRAMLDHKVDSIPVVSEDQRLVGLVTSSDFISLVVERERQLMSKPLPFHFTIRRDSRRPPAPVRRERAVPHRA